MALDTIPDSLTREEGSVDEVVNHPRQTIPHGFTRTTYYDENPFYFGAPTPQFQLLLLIRQRSLRPVDLVVQRPFVERDSKLFSSIAT